MSGDNSVYSTHLIRRSAVHLQVSVCMHLLAAVNDRPWNGREPRLVLFTDYSTGSAKSEYRFRYSDTGWQRGVYDLAGGSLQEVQAYPSKDFHVLNLNIEEQEWQDSRVCSICGKRADECPCIKATATPRITTP